MLLSVKLQHTFFFFFNEVLPFASKKEWQDHTYNILSVWSLSLFNKEEV